MIGNILVVVLLQFLCSKTNLNHLLSHVAPTQKLTHSLSVTYSHTLTLTHIIHLYTHTLTHIVHLYTHTLTYIVHLYTHTLTHSIHLYTHTLTHIIHLYIHTHTHTHTHTHSLTCSDLTLELPFTLTHPKPKYRVISQMISLPPPVSPDKATPSSDTATDEAKEKESMTAKGATLYPRPSVTSVHDAIDHNLITFDT